jgi:hypothetical protein
LERLIVISGCYLKESIKPKWYLQHCANQSSLFDI